MSDSVNETEIVQVTKEPNVPDMGALFGALAAARLEFGEILKKKTATISGDKSSYQYKYADLAAVLEATALQLAKHGLHVLQEPEVVRANDGKLAVIVYGEIVHKSGATRPLRPLTMPVAGFTPQAIGSAFSYGRRYQISGALNIMSEDDDDGAIAGQGLNDRRGSQRDEEYSARKSAQNIRPSQATTTKHEAPKQPAEQIAAEPSQPTAATAPVTANPAAKGTNSHERCWGIGMSVFGPEWEEGARSWLIEKWTARMKSAVRTSMSELSDAEKDVLGDYMNENSAVLQRIWKRDKAKIKEGAAQEQKRQDAPAQVDSQQEAAVAAGFAA